jgi:hypothetical protein
MEGCIPPYRNNFFFENVSDADDRQLSPTPYVAQVQDAAAGISNISPYSYKETSATSGTGVISISIRRPVDRSSPAGTYSPISSDITYYAGNGKVRMDTMLHELGHHFFDHPFDTNRNGINYEKGRNAEKSVMDYSGDQTDLMPWDVAAL